jgi:hypothetical protein
MKQSTQVTAADACDVSCSRTRCAHESAAISRRSCVVTEQDRMSIQQQQGAMRSQASPFRTSTGFLARTHVATHCSADHGSGLLAAPMRAALMAAGAPRGHCQCRIATCSVNAQRQRTISTWAHTTCNRCRNGAVSVAAFWAVQYKILLPITLSPAAKAPSLQEGKPMPVPQSWRVAAAIAIIARDCRPPDNVPVVGADVAYTNYI